MIRSDFNELEARRLRKATGIRMKELRVYTFGFDTLAGASTLLTGLSFSGMLVPTAVPTTSGVRQLHVSLFYLSTSLAIGFNIFTQMIASYNMMFGPSLAIRGNVAKSTELALAQMELQWRVCLSLFWAGLMMLMVSGSSMTWMKWGCDKYKFQCGQQYIAMTVTIILMVFFCAIFHSAKRLGRKLQFQRRNVDENEYPQIPDSEFTLNQIHGSKIGDGSKYVTGNEQEGSTEEKDEDGLESVEVGGIPDTQQHRRQNSWKWAPQQTGHFSFLKGPRPSDITRTSRPGGEAITTRQANDTGENLCVETPPQTECGPSLQPCHASSGPNKSGLLTKNGKLRFFQLQHYTLKYFTLNGKLKKVIFLNGREIRKVIASVGANDSVLEIVIDSYWMRLEAETKSDRDDWVQKFSKSGFSVCVNANSI